MPEWARDVRARLAPLRLSPTRESEIVEELAQHLDDRYREALAGGASPEEATRLALDDFRSGNVLATHLASLRQAHVPEPVTPGASTGHVLSDLWQDLRYAARTFLKQPGFAAATVLTLALGIGAGTAIFSAVYGVLLKPLPFPEPDRLVSLRHDAPHGAGTNQGPTTYLTYRENQRSFEAIGAWDRTDVSITGHGDPERVQALRVSASTLPLLRVKPIIGQLFDAEDERDDGLNEPPTAIVYWPMLNESYRWRTMAYAVRSNRVGTAGFLRELEQAVWSVDRNLPIAKVQTLQEIEARSMAQTSFALVMLSIAAGIALLIGIVGVYGVIAYAAAQRTREVGVRMALGAQAHDVRNIFLHQGLALTAAGIALGTAPRSCSRASCLRFCSASAQPTR